MLIVRQCLSKDEGKNEMRRMRGVMEDAIDRRLVLIDCLAGDVPTRVAVAVKTREIAARNF